MLFSAAATVEEVHAKEAGPKDVVLYQYEACPFCNKHSWTTMTYRTKLWRQPYRQKGNQVPILMVDGEQMVDSSDIIDKLAKKVHPDMSTDPAREDEEEKKWRRWLDNHLVHLLSPNIYRSISEAIDSFDYITTHGNFSFTERITAKYAGATAMYIVSKKLKKRHDITDERAALYEAAETWAKPNLADLAVYGVLRPIRYLKSGKDMVENTRIRYWYSRMENAVGISSSIQA